MTTGEEKKGKKGNKGKKRKEKKEKEGERKKKGRWKDPIAKTRKERRVAARCRGWERKFPEGKTLGFGG